MISYPIDDSFAVEVKPNSGRANLGKEALSEIDALWDKLQLDNRHLFNGQLLSALSLEGNRLVGEFVEYKHYMAQVHLPHLKNSLKIKPVCVCGLTTDGEKVLIGKRSKEVSTFQGFYELVPSGTVDASCYSNGYVDVRALFMRELAEEAGITGVKKFSFKAVVFDPETDTYEICAEIEVEKGLPTRAREEHDELFWGCPEAIAQQKFVPLTLFFLSDNKIF